MPERVNLPAFTMARLYHDRMRTEGGSSSGERHAAGDKGYFSAADVVLILNQLELPDDFVDADLDQIREVVSDPQARAEVQVLPGAEPRDPFTAAAAILTSISSRLTVLRSLSLSWRRASGRASDRSSVRSPGSLPKGRRTNQPGASGGNNVPRWDDGYRRGRIGGGAQGSGPHAARGWNLRSLGTGVSERRPVVRLAEAGQIRRLETGIAPDRRGQPGFDAG